MIAYVKLGLAALLPVFFSVILYITDKKTAFSKLNPKIKQAIYGILFGILAIIGTEFGIPLNGAQSNARDGAVLTAGLMFGAPAGIIAGLIGGIERWFAVYWGVGTFTRVACTVSTIIAGIYAAMLRKYMFEDKKPGWLISLAIGVVMEIFHLTMVFITNMNTPIEAMRVVKACTVPMVITNAVCVMLASMAISILAKDRLAVKQDNVRISQTIQHWLLVTVTLAFLATSYFVFSLQNRIAVTQTEDSLDIAIQEVFDDIMDASDKNLLDLTKKIYANLGVVGLDKITNEDLVALAKQYSVKEISIVDSNGIIVKSNENEYINNVNFHEVGGQAEEFLCLLGDTEEFVQEYGPISSDKTQMTMRKYAGIKTDDGFLQVGYDAYDFNAALASQVNGITKNRHVGKTGYVLISDSDHRIVSAPKSIDVESLSSSFDDISVPDENITFTVDINGTDNYCRYMTAEGYYIISILPLSEANQMRNIALYVNTFMEILVFAILFALIYLLIKKVVVNRIKSINESLSKITGGDLGVVVDVRSNAEFASLSDDINSTVDTLKKYIAEASARIDKELEFAKSIQSSALPSVFPAFPKHKDFDIYATMDTAKEVGGDFYDFYLTKENTLNFLIADVSGKGIPAAMFMMRAKTELKTLTEADQPLNDVFTRGNNALCEGNDAGMFVTAWQGSINLDTGKVNYVNAGHNPPLVYRAETGKFEYLVSRAGFVLAGMDGVRYKTQELQLMPGDTVFLYTDGVTEATDANEKLFGEDRLLEALNSRSFDDPRSVCEFVKEEIDKFVGDAPQFDDITMVALKYIGTPAYPSVSFGNAVINDVNAVTEFAEAELAKIGCSMKVIVQMNVVIDEIFSNIVNYAYGDKTGPVKVEVIENDDPHSVSLRFTDEGFPYNPLSKEDPDITLSADERSIGGLGIYMVKKSTDNVLYEYRDEKNILTVTKNL